MKTLAGSHDYLGFIVMYDAFLQTMVCRFPWLQVSAMAYWGRFDRTNPLTLPIAGAFQPAGGRQWLVKFWELNLFLTIHVLSDLNFHFRNRQDSITTSSFLEFTTFIAGLIGVPAPNGLIPQAPIHTTSLLVMGQSLKQEKDEE